MGRKQYIENNDFEASLNQYLEKINILGTETIDAIDSVGRITAKAIFAKVSDPTYNASAMDGITVLSANTNSANDRNPLTLSKDQYEYVNTGGVIKTCYDSVIMIEDVLQMENGDVQIIKPSYPWQHIRVVGESVVETEMILPSKRKIRPLDLGAILASGNEKIEVFKMPRIGIIPTGNEMVEKVSELQVGKLMESNTRVFFECAKEYGSVPKRYGIVNDEEILLEQAISKAAEENDIVVINAGSSAGTKDYTAKIIEKLGSVQTHGLAIKPGKPTILGFIGNKPVMGVPGYPVSAYIIFDKVVKSVVQKMNGLASDKNQVVKAELTKRLTSSFKNEEYIRVVLGEVGGKLVASPLSRGAAAVMSMLKADGMLKIPRNVEGVEVGEMVSVELLKSLADIKKSLAIVGSHDVVIDLIGDFMRVSSAHVGSMSGIMALKRGSAHIAPIHLLDSKTGIYNIAFVKQYFESGEMALIHGLQRVQGILTTLENPKNIQDLKSLKDRKCSFANRQRGAGTRLLFDFIMEKLEIPTSEVKGYEKEFTTHLAVATAVKNGVADCGLAVKSAANIMKLNFIPVGNENYDFLLYADMLEDERIQKFIEVLRSDEFKEQVEKIGGYGIDRLGEIEVVKW